MKVFFEKLCCYNGHEKYLFRGLLYIALALLFFTVKCFGAEQVRKAFLRLFFVDFEGHKMVSK